MEKEKKLCHLTLPPKRQADPDEAQDGFSGVRVGGWENSWEGKAQRLIERKITLFLAQLKVSSLS